MSADTADLTADFGGPIHLPTDWRDFAERVLRAAYTGAVSAATTIQIADWTDLVERHEATSLHHIAVVIGVGAVTAAWTAIKASIFQGRGSDPSNGSAK